MRHSGATSPRYSLSRLDQKQSTNTDQCKLVQQSLSIYLTSLSHPAAQNSQDVLFFNYYDTLICTGNTDVTGGIRMSSDSVIFPKWNPPHSQNAIVSELYLSFISIHYSEKKIAHFISRQSTRWSEINWAFPANNENSFLLLFCNFSLLSAYVELHRRIILIEQHSTSARIWQMKYASDGGGFWLARRHVSNENGPPSARPAMAYNAVRWFSLSPSSAAASH